MISPPHPSSPTAASISAASRRSTPSRDASKQVFTNRQRQHGKGLPLLALRAGTDSVHLAHGLANTLSSSFSECLHSVTSASTYFLPSRLIRTLCATINSPTFL